MGVGPLLITDQDLPEAVEPCMTGFDHPSSGAVARNTSLGLDFLAPLLYVGDVASLDHGLSGWFARITFVGAQAWPDHD